MTEKRRVVEHWIVGVARVAECPNVEALSIPQGTVTSDAWDAVVRTCGITEEQLLDAIAKRLRIAPARWDQVEQHTERLVPEKVARRYNVFPMRETSRQLVVATADPLDFDAERDVAFAAGRSIAFELATPRAIRTAIDASYAPATDVALGLLGADQEAEGLLIAAAADVGPEVVDAKDVEAPPIVNLVNRIMSDGVKRRASDIHIEPARLEGVVRFRIDGVMHEYLKVPMPVLTRVVSRIKILGQMDIADRMRPQDGRARIMFQDKTIDLRLSTVPTREAEKAVIRILDSTASKSLLEIGFPDQEYKRIRSLLRQRDGVVVVTGPTGSGKTTTLYSAVAEIASGTVNVVTIEDPVEYDLAGITQIQVETKRGVTFAGALRAVLRQDPDVILVGEVRDAETAETAAHAALTGHLVLTTLHTNDSVGVLQRLLDLGLEPGTVGDALRGVIAQRLVRRLCVRCAKPATAPFTEEETRLQGLSGVMPVNRAVGCEYCAGTGYFGRLAVPEVLIVSERIETMIAEGAPIPSIGMQARQEGMRLLHEVALDAVRDGRTTLDEVERVIGIPEITGDAPSMSVAPRPSTPVSVPVIGDADAPLILMVDDDPVSRTVVKAVLTHEGWQVEEAAEGFAALQRLLGGGPMPSLLLLDLEMPGIDGHTVVKQLRVDPRTRRLPIIILTGSEDRDKEFALMEDGADDYLNKPIEPVRLSARVKSVLRRAAMA